MDGFAFTDMGGVSWDNGIRYVLRKNGNRFWLYNILAYSNRSYNHGSGQSASNRKRLFRWWTITFIITWFFCNMGEINTGSLC